MEIKTILHPTDFSEGSDVVLPMLKDLLEKYNARLVLMHVIHDISQTSGWYVPHINMDELYNDLEEGAKKELERCCVESLRTYKNIEYVVKRGTPHTEILKYADEENVDLIVMGTHSRKGLDRVFFGSTASKVVRHSNCAVLTVPSHMGR